MHMRGWYKVLKFPTLEGYVPPLPTHPRRLCLIVLHHHEIAY